MLALRPGLGTHIRLPECHSPSVYELLWGIRSALTSKGSTLDVDVFVRQLTRASPWDSETAHAGHYEW